MRRWSICLVALLGALLLGQRPAHADGVHIRNTIDTRGVVKRSKIIFVAKVLSVSKRYSTRHAYGRSRGYVRAHQARVQVGPLLRGAKAFHGWLTNWQRTLRAWKKAGTLKKGSHLWKYRHLLRLKRLDQLELLQWSLTVPGKWRSVSDHYRGSYGLANAKVGDRLVVYLSDHNALQLKGSRVEASSRYYDAVKLVPTLRKLIGKVVAAEQLARRTNPRCKKLDYWHYRGRCRHQQRIQRMVRCPRGASLKLQASDSGLWGGCNNARGVSHGVYLQWHRSGYLYTRRHSRNGAAHGKAETWDEQGRLSTRCHYDDDRKATRCQGFHPNGKVSYEGRSRTGRRHGRWKHYDARGRLVRVECFKVGKQLWSSTKRREMRKRRCP